MAKHVEKWKAKDGTLFDNENEAIEHDGVGRFRCPQCRGYGWVHGEPITDCVYDADATAWGGQFARPVYKTVIVGYEKKPCELCDTDGWTDQEKTPIIETKIVGWK